MSVEVQIQEESARIIEIHYKLLGSVDRRLIYKGRVDVITIKVLPERVRSVVSTVNAVWIQHGNNAKNVLVSSRLSPRVATIEKEREESAYDVRCGDFAWVDTSRNKHVFFLRWVELKRSRLFFAAWKQVNYRALTLGQHSLLR